MSASESITVTVNGSNPEAVEAVAHSVGQSLQNDGFHNTVVFGTSTGEPELPNNTLMDLIRKTNPEIFNANVQVIQQFDAPESDAVGTSTEVEADAEEEEPQTV